MFIYPTFGNVCSELVGMKTYSPILGLSTLTSTSTSISPSARTMGSSVLYTKSAQNCLLGRRKLPAAIACRVPVFFDEVEVHIEDFNHAIEKPKRERSSLLLLCFS